MACEKGFALSLTAPFSYGQPCIPSFIRWLGHVLLSLLQEPLRCLGMAMRFIEKSHNPGLLLEWVLFWNRQAIPGRLHWLFVTIWSHLLPRVSLFRVLVKTLEKKIS